MTQSTMLSITLALLESFRLWTIKKVLGIEVGRELDAALLKITQELRAVHCALTETLWND